MRSFILNRHLSPITDLKQVETAAKVFNKADMTVTTNGKSIHYPSLMAIEPKAFGETAWFKESLLPHHWFQYLNLIANEPSAVLISKKIAESLCKGRRLYHYKLARF